jgi:hypothetical protein
LDYAASFPAGPRPPAGLFLVDAGLSQPDGEHNSAWEQSQELLNPPHMDGISQDQYLSRLAELIHPLGLDERITQILLADFEVGEDESLRPRLGGERRSQLESAMRAFEPSERLARVRCPVQAALAVPPEPVGRAPSERLVDNTNGLRRAREVLPELQIHRIPDTLFDIPLQRPVQLAQLIAGFAKQLP